MGWGLFIRLSFFTETKRRNYPVKDNSDLVHQTLPQKGTSIKPKNKYIIADYFALVNMTFQGR